MGIAVDKTVKSIRADVLAMPVIVPSARIEKLALAKGFTAPVDAGVPMHSPLHALLHGSLKKLTLRNLTKASYYSR